jgi:hypothetical protein
MLPRDRPRRHSPEPLRTWSTGIVLRCPRCDNALVTIVRDDTRLWIGFPGVRTLEVTI